MARKSKAKFTMSGHTLPGINQKSETVNIKDGRSPSSAFQMAEPGDSPLDINLKGVLGALNPVKTTKKLFGAGKSLLKGDIKGAFGALKPKNVLGSSDTTGGDDDASAGAELLKEEAKTAMQEGQV